LRRSSLVVPSGVPEVELDRRPVAGDGCRRPVGCDLEGEPLVEQLAEGHRALGLVLVCADLDFLEQAPQGPLGLCSGASHGERFLAVAGGLGVETERNPDLITLSLDLGSNASSHVPSRQFWDDSGTRRRLLGRGEGAGL
jgi:hypothetical protein